jgi:hypothetical protein
MKKNIILLTIYACITSTVFAQERDDRRSRVGQTRLSQINFVEKHYYKTKAAELNLKGKVKSIREDEYAATIKGDKFEKAADKKDYTYSHKLITFSETGNEMSSTLFNKGGSLDYSREFSYLKPGMVSQLLIFDGKHELESKYTYEYDVKDYLVTETKFDNKGKMLYQDKYFYTFPSNNSYEKQFFDTNGKLNPEKLTYTYNNDTLLSEERNLASDGANTWYYMYLYDNAQHVIKQTIYSSKAKKGEDPKVMGYEVSNIITFEYDANGNMTKMNQESIYDWDRKSSFLEEKHEYTYDSKGNWIRKISSGTTLMLEDTPKIVERQIEYY